jgi:sarcosine oxidase, subunit beta
VSTSTPTSAEVVVIGGGLEGCATAWALTRRGVTDVVIVERDTVGSGGTGKSSGVVRCHYGVSSLAAMATRSLETFEHAQDVLGADVGFHQTGYVVGVAEGNVEALHASMADQRAVGVRTEDIDHSEVRKLWPVADLEPFAAFAWEARGGYGDAYQTAQAFSAAARRAGARLRQGTTVSAIRSDGDRVTGVELADGTAIASEHVVLAASPWSVALLAAHGIDLPITVHREQIVLVDPGQDLGPVPVFSDLVSLQYIRAEASGATGGGRRGSGELLFGNSNLSVLEPADPDRYSNQASPSFVDVAVEKVGTRLPGLANPAISSTYAGCYDVTPDFNPVISRTRLEGLVVAAGFSGHGFKISPEVGRLTADLVVDGESSVPEVPAADFRLSRFAEGALLTSPHPYVGAGQMR